MFPQRAYAAGAIGIKRRQAEKRRAAVPVVQGEMAGRSRLLGIETHRSALFFMRVRLPAAPLVKSEALVALTIPAAPWIATGLKPLAMTEFSPLLSKRRLSGLYAKQVRLPWRGTAPFHRSP